MVMSATEPRRSWSWLGAVFRLAWLGALGFLAWSAWWVAMGEHGPQAHLERIELSLLPGQGVVLGRHELAAPAADLRHIRLWRDAQGQWWLSNVSDQRQVAWSIRNEKSQLRRLVLEPSQTRTVWVAGHAWTLRSEAQTLWLHQQVAPERVWRFDGALLSVGEQAALQPSCTDEPMGARLRSSWNQQAPHALAMPIKIDWGGTVACGNRLADEAVPRGELHLSRTAQGFVLQAQAETARRVCLSEPVQGICPAGASLHEQAQRLEPGLRVTLGRTTMLTELEGTRLTWTVLARGGWVPEDAQAPQPFLDKPDGVHAQLAQPSIEWHKTRHALWRLPAMLEHVPMAWAAGGAMVLLAVVSLFFQHVLKTSHGSALGLTVAVMLLLGSLALWALGAKASPGLSLGGVGLAMASLVWLPGATGWRWASHAMLATMLLIGLALQWALGLQAADTGGWMYFQKTAAFGALGLTALGVMAWWQAARQNSVHPLRRQGMLLWEGLLMGVGLCALAGLAAQVVWGGEGGVFGFQPVELAKLALVALGAHALALKLDWADDQGAWHSLKLWLRFVTPVTLFIAVSAIALLSVRDYSPVLLILTWLLGMLLAWAVVASSWPAGVLAMLMVGCGLVGWNVLHSPQGVQWMQAHGFYADRFAVWLDLFGHPHSGEQLMRALGLATQGGWTGNSLAPAWRVPAVQDDMAPAFVAGRFGLGGVLVLWAVQFSYLGCLLMLGWRALRGSQRGGDYQQRWAARMVFFCATGAAALFAGHLLLSWGTNTGWLPVMGQPMPLISAGGSVLVLFLLPLHLFWQWQQDASGGPRQMLV